MKFLGVRQDVCELMQAMDLFLLPSLYEGLPFVLIEAQVSELPCLASNIVISKEAKISDLLEYIDLDREASFWVERILVNIERMIERRLQMQ